jgi:hypothetical protein
MILTGGSLCTKTKACTSSTLSTTNPTLIELVVKTDPSRRESATKDSVVLSCIYLLPPTMYADVHAPRRYHLNIDTHHAGTTYTLTRTTQVPLTHWRAPRRYHLHIDTHHAGTTYTLTRTTQVPLTHWHAPRRYHLHIAFSLLSRSDSEAQPVPVNLNIFYVTQGIQKRMVRL